MDKKIILEKFNQLIQNLSAVVSAEDDKTYKSYSKPLIDVINAKNEFLFCNRLNDEYKKAGKSKDLSASSISQLVNKTVSRQFNELTSKEFGSNPDVY
ncbi:hypothetical protein [Lactobacillus crispatus]|uniref:hypothetical protein n=1 Tax=Lactobacillus crispatus TaxID=47770 RepID=UPI0023A92D06|nr:hypothetical protein [Lactobacillus crispatus]WEB33779.1 hypothetical protein PUW44_05995 [Lactobacillus crispatus]